jgi:hypothetical protein
LPQPLAAAFNPITPDVVVSWVVQPLQSRGIETYRLWWVDVAEHFITARDIYDKLSDPNLPPYDAVAPSLEAAFDRHRTASGISLRHQRLVFAVEVSQQHS